MPVAVRRTGGAVANLSDNSEPVSTTVFLFSSSILARSTVPLGGITLSLSAKLTGIFSAVTKFGGVSGQYEGVTGSVTYAESIGRIDKNNDGVW